MTLPKKSQAIMKAKEKKFPVSARKRILDMTLKLFNLSIG